MNRLLLITFLAVCLLVAGCTEGDGGSLEDMRGDVLTPGDQDAACDDDGDCGPSETCTRGGTCVKVP